MKKIIFISYFIILLLFLIFPKNILAQDNNNRVGKAIKEATRAAEASESAKLATASALVKKIVEKKADITEPNPVIKGRLEKYLEDNPPGELTVFSFIRHAIINAVSQGVPPNTIVLMLMFPLVAAIVVFSRHIIGLKSFGIFTPALLAVAFLNTGLLTGSLLFLLILAVATIMRMALRKIRIQYLPRMAVFIWVVSMTIFAILLLSPFIGQEELITIGIFPILILILLLEDFLDIQITRSFKDASLITIETLLVAYICFFTINFDFLQKFALLNPELFMVGIFLFIILIERYDGLRLMEIWRFRKLLK
ncbi:hypothetical protein GYA19_01055 [Candidatus Beckwithbacteria bacterium]|nr:hypothetical protein [Candidatus Beckwithbacteria bacterium]